jgi:hypothetical protein
LSPITYFLAGLRSECALSCGIVAPEFPVGTPADQRAALRGGDQAAKGDLPYLQVRFEAWQAVVGIVLSA